MGSCVSTANRRSTCETESHSPMCFQLGFCGHMRAKRTVSVDHVIAMQQHLSSVPNRIFSNGKSTTSCIFTQQGRKGVNQDAMIMWEDFMSEDVTFCGVFDGHGPHGHLVARKVRDVLPLKLMSSLNSCRSRQNGSNGMCFMGNSKGSDGSDSEKDGSSAEDGSNSLWREAFMKSYKAMDKELKSRSNFNCFCSGSTAITIVKQGSNLFMGHIGDSRAVMGSKDGNSMVAIQLTVDLKPDLPREAERIKRCKGRVFALEDEPEVCRVWLPFDDAPELAMARAFRDFCLKEYGVINVGFGSIMILVVRFLPIISIPEFSHRLLTERDQFIILASDGVWDVLSNEEVVEIVTRAPTRSSAAWILVDSAARQWKLKYPTSKMDDCAVVCLYLDGKMESESDNEEQGFSSATFESNRSSNVHESDDGHKSEPSLQRNNTVTPSEESDGYGRLSPEFQGNADTFAGEEQNWSGLEDITRVNSLVQLPRFSQEKQNS